jgi:hypothetical protein
LAGSVFLAGSAVLSADLSAEPLLLPESEVVEEEEVAGAAAAALFRLSVR